MKVFAAFWEYMETSSIHGFYYIHPRNHFWPLQNLNGQNKISILMNKSVVIDLKIESMKSIADDENTCTTVGPKYFDNY